MQKQEDKVKTNNVFPEMENEVLNFWDKGKIFEKSVKNPPTPPLQGGQAKEYVFYDGPPFATGTPHYGHIVGSLMKDVVPRFWTMNGYRVERRWGWDCHGLPIENIVEKEMGSKSKKDIEEAGIEKFNELCRSKVLGYVDEWERVIRRLGRWADMKNSYKTMDKDFMESVWWVFKELYDRGLIYEGHRSMHVCPRCETTLSQQEVAEGYKDIKDLSCIAKFELEDSTNLQIDNKSTNTGKTYILAWTTTPWTLIGNVALAVNPDEEYLEVVLMEKKSEDINFEIGQKIIFVDKSNIQKKILGDEIGHMEPMNNPAQIIDEKYNSYEVVKDAKGNIYGYAIREGKELIGKKYKPLFNYYTDKPVLSPEESASWENGWKIYGAPFVTTEDGTGVVHIAPAFGEDDLNLGNKENLPFIQHVGMDGIVKEEIKDFAGMDLKPRAKDKPTEIREADLRVVKYLGEKIFDSEKYEHSYPHCWRCDTPLINYATSSWFVAITKIKNKMLESAKKINWSPAHIKEGRFGQWLEGARDWSISRQRFWASVIPIWRCDCGEIKVIGSVEEINKKLNSFLVLRHGEAVNNLDDIMSDRIKDGYGLTEKGKIDIKKIAEKLISEKIELIISSDLDRAKETAEIISKVTNAEVVFDERIREVSMGDYNGKTISEARDFRRRWENGEDVQAPNGESWADLSNRMKKFYDELFLNHRNKNILVISHGDAITALEAILSGEDYLKQIKKINKESYIEKGELRKLSYKLSDLHKHIVDKITFKCEKCAHSAGSGQAGEMKRVPDVLDCWFESGSMPYAQNHYPFENKEKFENNFPAEFIAEGIDQTRAWFYYLHAIANGIKDTHAFNNVIVNGIVLAEDGKKMSKRLQNYPNPTFILDQYGADALRYYLLSSPVMQAENFNFSESGVKDSLRNVNMILWNVYKFYEMYANNYELRRACRQAGITNYELEGKNILDKWIMARLNQLVGEVTENMKAYNLPKAIRPIEEFINDLSTWYLRRSRDRFKTPPQPSPSQEREKLDDKECALATTKHVLLELAKVMAPFTPFIAENIWQKVSGNNLEDENKSVHLESWPEQLQITNDELRILEEMEVVRKLVEQGLAAREICNIKVRQPLSELRVGKEYFLKTEYLELIKDELNVKTINNIDEAGVPDKNDSNWFIFSDIKGLENYRIYVNINITPELKMEGVKRELVRFVNNMRKDLDMTIHDRAEIYYHADSQLVNDAFEKFGDDIKKDTLSEKIIKGVEDAGVKKEIKIDGEIVVLGIEKIK